MKKIVIIGSGIGGSGIGALLAKETSHQVQLFEKNKLILERTTPEKGEAHDEIDIKYSGKPCDVAFNGNFIIDFLTHIESTDIQIGINDSESSFIFKPREKPEVNYIYVVMPLNI